MAFHFIVQKLYPEHESVRKNSNNVLNKRAHVCQTSTKKSTDSVAKLTARIKKLEDSNKLYRDFIARMNLLLKPDEPKADNPASQPATKTEAGASTPLPVQNRIEFLQGQIKSVTRKIESSNNFREVSLLRESLNALCEELNNLESQQLRSSIQKQERSLDEKFLVGWATGSGKAARCQYGKPW